MWRLLTNKLLVLNYCSTIFYVLGGNTYHTYLTKYIEVQFNKTAAAATIFTGPISIVGTMVGFLLSGYVMTKWQIHARKIYLWCVICGFISVIVRLLFMQLSCENSNSLIVNDTWVQPVECNEHCNCGSVAYSPVCDTLSETTYFSACHAGCEVYNESEKYYTNCTCASGSRSNRHQVALPTGICSGNCENAYILFTVILLVSNLILSTGLIGNLMLNFR